ncbi:MAG TPA: carbon storage regulator CsrA [Solirubrobacteraceae bacterium]|jgi:carbon storage regulator
MLVLTRKSNQSIMIGDDIEVSVLSVMGDKVRIGIQAPTAVPVFRTEIYIEIHGDQGKPARGNQRGQVGRGQVERGQIESAIDDALDDMRDGSAG